MVSGLCGRIWTLQRDYPALADAAEHSSASTEKHAKYTRDTVVPAMNAVRETAEAHARVAGTIGYEIMTGIGGLSARARRIVVGG